MLKKHLQGVVDDVGDLGVGDVFVDAHEKAELEEVDQKVEEQLFCAVAFHDGAVAIEGDVAVGEHGDEGARVHGAGFDNGAVVVVEVPVERADFAFVFVFGVYAGSGVGRHDHEEGLAKAEGSGEVGVDDGVFDGFGVVADDKVAFGADVVFAAEGYGAGNVAEAVFFVHERQGGFARAFDAEAYFAEADLTEFAENPFGADEIFCAGFGHDTEVGEPALDHEVTDFFGPPDVGQKVGIPDFEEFFVFGVVKQGDFFDDVFGAAASPAFVHLVVGAKGAAPGATAGGVYGVDGVGAAFFAVTAGAERTEGEADGVDVLDGGPWLGINNTVAFTVGDSLDLF